MVEKNLKLLILQSYEKLKNVIKEDNLLVFSLNEIKDEKISWDLKNICAPFTKNT